MAVFQYMSTRKTQIEFGGLAKVRSWEMEFRETKTSSNFSKYFKKKENGSYTCKKYNYLHDKSFRVF
jgi:hypothetical protein